METFIHTDAKTNAIYTVERARANSRKLIASVMPISPIVPDQHIPWVKVPLKIRRLARAALDAA